MLHFTLIFITHFYHLERQIRKIDCPLHTALIQRVPALRGFWDLEKTVLHETCVSGTVLWSPTNANSPTYT